MFGSIKTALALGAVVTAATVVCPFCGDGANTPVPAVAASAAQTSDTALVRLRISGMTCGSCPITARFALRKLPGIYSAVVTLDDSLGVVRYDPRKATTAQITSQLTRLTGFRASVLADGGKAPARSGM